VTTQNAKPSAAIILPENEQWLAKAYSAMLEKAGWKVSTPRAGDFAYNGEVVIIGFEIAAANQGLAASIPADRLVIDFHYDAAYESGERQAPFHLLDYVTAIVHDHEGERLIRSVVRSLNCRIVMFPYVPDVAPAAITGGSRKIYSITKFYGHPWLAGMDVEFVSSPFPKTAPQNSFIAAPGYDPALWPLIFWGAGASMPLVLPAVETFQRLFFHGAALFDPKSEEDFKIKVKALTRPAPAKTDKPKLKIGVAVPRYGKNAPGGAETLAAQLAENLAAMGHDAEILTTRTDSMLKWNNNLPSGEEMDGKVKIRRFGVDNTDQTKFHHIGHKINRREDISYSEEVEWLRLSIRSTAMEKHIELRGDEYDWLFFIPYLYGTTYWGSQIAPEKSFLIPCYHKEPPAFTRALRLNGGLVAGLSFNTLSEKRMAESELGIDNPGGVVIGAGLNTEEKGDAQRFRSKFGASGDFLLYVGRLQREKNVPVLLDYFREYARESGGGVGLMFAGKGDVKIPEDSGIHNLGFVSEQEKIDACAACYALVLPSTQESFSFVMMEAWLQGRPVLADGRCNVAREHIYASGGGLLYHGAEGFAGAVTKLRKNPALANEMGAKGRQYVLDNFKWSVIAERLVNTLRTAEIKPIGKRLGEHAKAALAAFEKSAPAAFEQWINDAERMIAMGKAHHAVSTRDILSIVEESSDIGTIYREFSNRAMIGAALSRLRGALTRHIQKNYIEVLESKQSAFNKEAVRLLKRMYGETRGDR